MTVLLAGLICVSSGSGFFAVICYGADGHVAVEAIVHNHCACPQPDESNSAKTFIGLYAEHEHCKDTLAPSNPLLVKHKSKYSSGNIFSTTLVVKHAAVCDYPFLGRFADQSNPFPSFYTPLRTVVLLV